MLDAIGGFGLQVGGAQSLIFNAAFFFLIFGGLLCCSGASCVFSRACTYNINEINQQFIHKVCLSFLLCLGLYGNVVLLVHCCALRELRSVLNSMLLYVIEAGVRSRLRGALLVQNVKLFYLDSILIYIGSMQSGLRLNFYESLLSQKSLCAHEGLPKSSAKECVVFLCVEAQSIMLKC